MNVAITVALLLAVGVLTAIVDRWAHRRRQIDILLPPVRPMHDFGDLPHVPTIGRLGEP